MNSRPRPSRSPVSLSTLEGLFAGSVAGGVLLLLERSPTFHVFADVLNAAFRVLAARLPEAQLVRLDTEGVATAIYVGGHALLGAGLGAVLPVALSRMSTGFRRILLGLLLLLIDALVLGTVWKHRGLSLTLGSGLVLAAATAATLTAAVIGTILSRLVPGATRRGLAVALPLGVVIASAITLGAAVSGPPRPDGRTLAYPRREPTDVRVAILGVDGLDGILVDEAIAAGRMPNLARLIAAGTRGDLRSIRPPKSPVVWTSIATGMLPSVHGITDFVVRRDGRSIPVTGNLRRSPALWDMAALADFDVAFVNWYVTWPAEEVPGVMISDRVDFDGLGERVYPESLLARVEAARARVEARPDRSVARFTELGERFDGWRARRWGQVRRSLNVLDDVVRHDLVTLETAREALADGQPDLTAMYFRGNDNTQHLFWKYRLATRSGERLSDFFYDDLNPEDVEQLAEVVDLYYDFADEMIGEAIALLEPNTAVLLLSDHGFLANNERSRWWNPNPILEAAGLCRLTLGAGGAADPATSRVLDSRPPSVERRRILRAGEATEDPEADLEIARAALASARTEAGDPVFRRVEASADAEGPFLVAVFEDRPAGDTVRIGDRETNVGSFTVPEGHSGDHRMNGFLLAVGGPFRPGDRVEGARALDIAPTVLHLIGAPAGRDMEGSVLLDLFDPQWLNDHPVRYVESYGTRETTDAEAIETGADDRIREELKALGYIK